jgi:hypothetical protein
VLVAALAIWEKSHLVNAQIAEVDFDAGTLPVWRLIGYWPLGKLVIERGENPLLQNGSKVRLYVLKDPTHTHGLNIED